MYIYMYVCMCMLNFIQVLVYPINLFNMYTVCGVYNFLNWNVVWVIILQYLVSVLCSTCT